MLQEPVNEPSNSKGVWVFAPFPAISTQIKKQLF